MMGLDYNFYVNNNMYKNDGHVIKYYDNGMVFDSNKNPSLLVRIRVDEETKYMLDVMSKVTSKYDVNDT